MGTIDAYYDASMDLVSVHPHLDLYNEAWPIRGAQSACGPAKFVFSDEGGGRVGSARWGGLDERRGEGRSPLRSVRDHLALEQRAQGPHAAGWRWGPPACKDRPP